MIFAICSISFSWMVLKSKRTFSFSILHIRLFCLKNFSILFGLKSLYEIVTPKEGIFLFGVVPPPISV